MYASLRAHLPRFTLWALCLDGESYDTLSRLALADVVPLRLNELEHADSGLAAAKPHRSTIEYYFTCTPCLPLFLFDRDRSLTQLTYLDADLFFFADPSPIFDEVGSSSVAIIEHRFPEGLRRLEETGRFNVGWLTFRRDESSLACLRWWRERCLDSCSDLPSEGRYADQKYLDEWPMRFRGVAIVQHRGANVAPWNVANYRLSGRDGRLAVNGEALLFYHFHGLRERGGGLYETGLNSYGVATSRLMMRELYVPYIRTLRRIARELGVDGAPLGGRRRAAAGGDDSSSSSGRPSRWIGRVREALRKGRDMLSGRYLFVWNGYLISTGR